MNRTRVDSRMVLSVGYDYDHEVLELEFNNGSVYQYLDVPESAHRMLTRSESVGKYVHAEIVDQYTTIRIA